MAVFAGPEIENQNLQIAVDSFNPKSYATGDTWKDMVSNVVSTSTSIPSVLNSPTWLQNEPVLELSIIAVVHLLGTSNAYAYHPVNKWTGTNNATFVLYHFQEFTDNLRTYMLQWYANRGGVWGDISNPFIGAANNHYCVGLQYNANTGGQLWINGNKISGRRGSGALANNNITVKIDGGPQPRVGIHHTKQVYMYNSELADSEMIQVYESLKGRYDI